MPDYGSDQRVHGHKGFLTWLGLLVWLSFVLPSAWAEVAVPALKGRVTDLTGTLSAEQAAGLERRLAALEQTQGSQLAVLIVATTQPESIEQYSLRVAESWRLGRKGVDDGLLLLVAKEDRTLRIEVGYGLEGVVPDAVAHRIIDEDIVPRFRAGDYAGGVEAGVSRLVQRIAGEPKSVPAAQAAPSDNAAVRLAQQTPDWAVALVIVGGPILFMFFGSLLGASILGILAGLGAFWMGGGLVTALIAGVVVFIVTLFAFGGGIGQGGGGSGGKSSGGGFSGGGGGFGGGGASGRW